MLLLNCYGGKSFLPGVVLIGRDLCSYLIIPSNPSTSYPPPLHFHFRTSFLPMSTYWILFLLYWPNPFSISVYPHYIPKCLYMPHQFHHPFIFIPHIPHPSVAFSSYSSMFSALDTAFISTSYFAIPHQILPSFHIHLLSICNHHRICPYSSHHFLLTPYLSTPPHSHLCIFHQILWVYSWATLR